MVCNAQDRLQMAMDRYEYGAAAQIFDSLIKGMSADSIMVSQNKDRRIIPAVFDTVGTAAGQCVFQDMPGQDPFP